MLVKTQYKTKTEIILQHPIRSPPSSHNTLVDTGATNFFVITNKPILSLRVQLPNVKVLKSTHDGNLQITALPNKATNSHVLPHITSCVLF